MEWTWASAKSRGTSHIKTASRLQDASSSATIENAFISIIADGAGSACMGGQGASIVCRFMMNRAKSLLRTFDKLPTESEVVSWLDGIRTILQLAADARELQMRDFASTLVFAASLGTNTIVAHIGDGTVVVQDQQSKSWQVISWPEQGEYASTTFFVTDTEPQLRFIEHLEPIAALVLLSDGLERLSLNMATKEPFSPFFDGMTKPLMMSSKNGKDQDVSKSLQEFLDGDAVNARTDDDKTLVLAVCH